MLGAEGQGGGGGEFGAGTSHQFVLILVRKRMTSTMFLGNPMGGYRRGRKSFKADLRVAILQLGVAHKHICVARVKYR